MASKPNPSAARVPATLSTIAHRLAMSSSCRPPLPWVAAGRTAYSDSCISTGSEGTPCAACSQQPGCDTLRHRPLSIPRRLLLGQRVGHRAGEFWVSATDKPALRFGYE